MNDFISNKPVVFSHWRFEPSSGELFRCGDTHPRARLEPKPAQVLIYLAHRPGLVVSRAQLQDHLWSDRVVGDESLTRCISILRRELEDRRPYRYIQTLPKRGYRFIAQPVRRVDESAVRQQGHRHNPKLSAGYQSDAVALALP